MAKTAAIRPVVGGVGISHPDRLLFPAVGLTKLDLAHYCAAIAPLMLPHVIERPLTLVHCPKGIPAGDASVSVPLAWNELRASLAPERLTVSTVVRRFARRADPWRRCWPSTQTLPRGAAGALHGF